jgi:hypothetical protein
LWKDQGSTYYYQVLEIRRKPPKENLAKRFPSRKDLDHVTKDTGSRHHCNSKMAGMERERRV